MGQCHCVTGLADSELERRYAVGERMGRGKLGQLYEGTRRRDDEHVTIEAVRLNKKDVGRYKIMKKKLDRLHRKSMAQRSTDDEETIDEQDPVLEVFQTATRAYVVRDVFRGAHADRPKAEFVRELKKTEDIKKVYSLREEIGTGEYGVVRRGIRRKDRLPVAVKEIQKANLTTKAKQAVYKEIEMLRKIENKFVVTTYEVLDSPDVIYIIMELLRGGELHRHIGSRFCRSEKDVSRIVCQISQGLHYLHTDRNIVHRDIKPENLVFSSKLTGVIKIADFGLATPIKQGIRQPCGTPSYVAPEVLQQKNYGAAVDMWSLGVVMYILICGYAPFQGRTVNRLYDKIKRGKFVFPHEDWDAVSPDAKHLIFHLLELDPRKRFTAAQVLSHPFVKKQNQKRVLARAQSASHGNFDSVLDMPSLE